MATNQAKHALLCAYTLAKAGRYSEAEAKVLSEPEISKQPAAIDFLARVRVEQGDVIEARRLWEELTISHPSYLPARIALKNLNKRPPIFTRKRVTFIFSTLLLVGAFLLGFFLSPKPKENVVPPTISYQWETLPMLSDLQALSIHRDKVQRVYVSSHLFADPKALASRQNLIEALRYLLAIEAHQVYFAQGQLEKTLEDVLIELEPQPIRQ